MVNGQREKRICEKAKLVIIMIAFKGKVNDILKYLHSEKNSEVVIVLHNLVNKFKLTDISINKIAKTSIQSSWS